MKKNLTLILFLLYISCGKDAPVETPTPQIIKYTLSFSAGSGGSVSIPGGSYETGTSVSVTATPDSEYVFVDWSNGSTQNPLSVSVNSNLTLTANFEKRKYPLTMNIVGEGTVSEEIISAGRTTTEYTSGSVIRLTANPSDEWVFTGWSGSVSSTTNPIELTVDESKTISVTFIKRQYPLTINIQGEGTVSEEIISAGKTTEYNSGSVVRLTAQPLEGNFPGAPVHVFSGWTGDYEGTENPIELNITQAMSLTAIFAIVQVVTVGDNKLFIDKSGIPDGDNYKLITEIIPSTGEIKLYFHNIIDRNGVWGNISLWENKLIKWRGTNDSLKNPILVQPNNQIIKPVIGNLYDYLENEYDMPFIYSWDQQMEHTQNKPMGWEGKFLDYEGDGDPDIFGLRNNNNGGKDFVVVGYDRSTRNYFLKKEVNLTENLNLSPSDSTNTGNAIVGDFNNDNILDFFGNAHGEWGADGGWTINLPSGPNIFYSGPMFASVSNGLGNYTSTIVDEEKYLRFPGSTKTVDWNFDGLLDVFAASPYMVYLNNGDGTFDKLDLSNTINPELVWLSIAFDDLNNDGVMDIVGANFNMQGAKGFGMEIYYGSSNNNFIYETVFHPLWNGTWNGSDDLTIVDIDGDGYKEILTYNMIELQTEFNTIHDVSEMREFKSTGGGYSLNTNSNYNVTIKTSGGAGSNSTTAWDFDGDGDLDVFLQSHKDTSVFIFLADYYEEIPYAEGGMYNQFLKIEQQNMEDFNNCNVYITGYFFENVTGVLVKRYFNELYND